MPQNLGYGTPTRVSATGIQVIASVNSALIGIVHTSTATAAPVNIYHGVTASVEACTTVQFASGSVASFLQLPMFCSGGLTIDLGATADPSLTLFWNPTGGDSLS